ncbi:MAG: hypothetical protein HRT52_16500 [Colwellia sp.]|nr:hypothetical protein [Colwellia sp.]
MRGIQIVVAFIISYFVFSGTPASGEVEPPFLKKSAVLFTQPFYQELQTDNYGKYQDYGVDATLWGFLPPTFSDFDALNNFDEQMKNYVNGIELHKTAGIDWISRIEWDVIWRGMTSKYPESYQQATVKRLDGSAMEISWFPGHYFFSTHESLFQEYVHWQIQDVAFYRDATDSETIDGLLFDSQHSTPAQYYSGGDFSSGCMENFSTWLATHYSVEELSALAIPDISTFHYGNYLIAAGYTVERYESEVKISSHQIPLANLFKHFLQDWNNSYLADLVKFSDDIAQEQGYPYKEGLGYIPVGTSSPILDPFWQGLRFPANDVFDFYVQEFDHQANKNQPIADVMLLYKLAESLNKPLMLTGQPYPDWNFMVDNPKAVDLPRSWIAQAYANGAVFMAPEHMWAYKGTVQRYYQPKRGDYDFIFRWIAENSYLFDGYQTVAKVGLVYSHKAYRQSEYQQLDVIAAAAELMEKNIPFKLLVAGDTWWPKYLTDVDQASAINDYEVIVTTLFNGIPLNLSQQNILNDVAHKVVVWPDTESILSILPNQISIDVDNVAVFPRRNNTHPHTNAPNIVHLVNRDYDKTTQSMKRKEQLTLTVANELFNEKFVGARYNQAGHPSVEVTVEIEQDCISVTLPNLDNWGIVELFKTLPIPDKREFIVTSTELPVVNSEPKETAVPENKKSSGGTFVWLLLVLILALLQRIKNMVEDN